MSAQVIILAHDMWRKGAGGAPAGLVGQADSFAYAGLDLGLAQFAGSSFSGSSFTATSFRQAGWTGCRFDGASISASTFTRCHWDDISFERGQWNDVGVLDCSGTVVHAQGLQGRSVDFTGSRFEQLEFRNANIN